MSHGLNANPDQPISLFPFLFLWDWRVEHMRQMSANPTHVEITVFLLKSVWDTKLNYEVWNAELFS